jgi:hypothetical protein
VSDLEVAAIAAAATIAGAIVAALSALGGVRLQSHLARTAQDAENARRDRRDRDERVRAYRLAEIEATRRHLHHKNDWIINWLAGAPLPERQPIAERPLRRLELLGADLRRSLIDLHAELEARYPGSMPTRADMNRLAELHNRADIELRQQQLRVLADEPVVEIEPSIEQEELDDRIRTDRFMDTVDAMTVERDRNRAKALADALIATAQERAAAENQADRPAHPE